MRAVLIGLALTTISVPAYAQTDLSGFYNLAFEPGPPDGTEAELTAKLPANTVVLEDTGAPEYPRGVFGGLKLTAEAQARAETWDPEDDMTLSRVCLPPSIVYAVQGPFPLEIHQTPELIVFKYEYFDQVRLIHMDGRQHPADAPHTKMGYSTGRWEGDELVVETTHIAPSTITNNGLDHSDQVRMVERYKLSDDGKRLYAMQWFSDPVMLENNGARFIEWHKQEGQHVLPYECDPAFALEYQATANPEQ